MVGHYDLINRDNTRVGKEFVLLVLHKLHTSLLTMINFFLLRAYALFWRVSNFCLFLYVILVTLPFVLQQMLSPSSQLRILDQQIFVRNK